jgi:hypothetical protein
MKTMEMESAATRETLAGEITITANASVSFLLNNKIRINI